MTKCLICEAALEASVKGYLKCPACGLHQREKMPTAAALKRSGKNFMLSACRSDKRTATRIRVAHQDLKALDRAVKGERGLLFDVGAAGGFMMYAAAECGWQVHGNEISTAAITWGRKNLGVEIYYGVLEEISFDPGAYTAVTFWNTLEHLANPMRALEIAFQMLRPGGWVYIKVPLKCVEDIEHAYEGKHTCEFTYSALQAALTMCGFDYPIMTTTSHEHFTECMALAEKPTCDVLLPAPAAPAQTC